MESVTIKIPNKMIKEIDKQIEVGYNTRSEFIRDAIRKALKEKEIKEFRKVLEKMQADYKKLGRKPVTDEDLRRAREETWKEFEKKLLD
jgi:Arc/MetJ-type ribon-helix-helix transcriptional regulator